MRSGSVVVDLAVESGGNVEGSQVGQVVDLNGVKIVGHANMPARLAPATSALYARNAQFRRSADRRENQNLVINDSDDLIKGALISRTAGSCIRPCSAIKPPDAISGTEHVSDRPDHLQSDHLRARDLRWLLRGVERHAGAARRSCP